ncbi:hypothetical protein ACX5G2_002129 [Pseudomonas aeruginosa]
MSKELNKAPVEQAGGDERVKCAVCVDSDKVYDISGEGPWKCYACTGSHEVVGYANGDELDNMLDDRTAVLSPVKTSFHTVPVYREARDALEQPSGEVVVTKNESGAIVSVTRQDKEGRVLSVIAESQPSPVPTEGFTHFPELLESVQQMDAMLKANSAQAEAERLEVVGVRYEDGTILSAEDCGTALEVCAKVQTPLMTVAQHERIVGELRAVIAQLRQHKNDYMDSGQETYRALQNEIREREAEIARLDGLVSGRTAERDAALAEVERLRQFERICEWLPQDAIDGGWTVQGIRRYAKRLEDQLKVALARVAELEAKLVRVTELERQEPVSTEHLPMHIAYARAKREVFLGACQEDVFRFALIDLLQEFPLYAAPVAQAQHSVPEGWRIERSAERIVVMNLKNGAGYAAARDGESGIAESVLYLLAADLLAAAPGKEGV